MKISKSKVIILSVIIVICIIAVITVNCIKEKRKEELEQRIADDQVSIESFMTGKSATFEEFLTECKISMDDINAVMIGTDNNESGIYINGERVLEPIICNDIVRVEIVNESGDRIDFYQTTKEEIEEFIN